ncbi:hypothetical protein BT96DRAFT_992520 [Gymnopus androsaceus JB14]|uniref:Uncharacterized protein n=1 Tax=Gymnopus androsaceus JB14 TaxID=1447944 RepID=A0A6A4HR98_9AGAR|nr:hypothetical protein BT96DRAFT_992520 [Gymnopus androsaceus JB14]
MDRHTFTEDRSIITRLGVEATDIEAKSELPPHLCGLEVKMLSDEIKVATKIVAREYTTAPGTMQKIEMLGDLAVRLRDLFEIMAKYKKILDMLNEGSIVVVVRAGQYSKKIKAYHEKLKRIRAEIETTITRMKTSWWQQAHTSISREEQQTGLGLVAEVSSLPSSLPRTITPTLGQITPTSPKNGNMSIVNDNAGDGQGEGTIPVQPMSHGIPSTLPPGSLINNDIAVADASPGQAGAGTLSPPSMETSTPAQPISQEAPSASLSHTRIGTLSLNTVGNDVNNTTVHDHSRHTGNGNTVVFNIENMVFNHFWNTNSTIISTYPRSKKLTSYLDAVNFAHP